MQELGHQLEERLVVLEVAGFHQAHRIKVGREDVRIFVDGAVLDDVFAALADVHHLTETAVEEENLDVERPALHVLIEAVEVRVVFNFLIMRLPVEVLGQQSREGRFA